MKTNRKSLKYCFEHTKQRMLERHSLDLSREEYNTLCTKYNSHKSIKIISIEKDQHVFETDYKNNTYRFVWCDNRCTITTVF